MATWITHLMTADLVLKAMPAVHRRGFCVGNIAPDCNIENDDWTAYDPPREITHWMTGSRKNDEDAERFWQEYVLPRRRGILSAEEDALYLGYYTHLLTDAAYERFIRDPVRMKAVWTRLRQSEVWKNSVIGLPEDFDSFKKVVPKTERLREISALEAEYLHDHPESGYLTEILPLAEFPDYIEYLPHGAIVRKIGVMGTLPELDDTMNGPVSVSREEFYGFAQDTAALAVQKLRAKLSLTI